MKPETLAIVVTVALAAVEALHFVLFLRIRVGQLESEKRVLDEVDRKYVRKPQPRYAVAE